MNLLPVLMTGLFAGGVSCAAVQGGLLTGLVARQRGTSPASLTPAAPQRRPKGLTRYNASPATTVEDPKRATWRAQLADDLTPVGGFLFGKLVSHTLLGALLGALGATVQLSTSARTFLQIGAGLLIVTFGLAQPALQVSATSSPNRRSPGCAWSADTPGPRPRSRPLSSDSPPC